MPSTCELRLVYRGVPRKAFVAGEVAEVTDVVRLNSHRPRNFAAFARALRAAA